MIISQHPGNLNLPKMGMFSYLILNCFRLFPGHWGWSKQSVLALGHFQPFQYSPKLLVSSGYESSGLLNVMTSAHFGLAWARNVTVGAETTLLNNISFLGLRNNNKDLSLYSVSKDLRFIWPDLKGIPNVCKMYLVWTCPHCILGGYWISHICRGG